MAEGWMFKDKVVLRRCHAMSFALASLAPACGDVCARPWLDLDFRYNNWE